MGDMRKDYVLEREVIVHPTTKKNTDTKRYSLLVGKSSQNNFIDSESIGEKMSLFRDFSSTVINALQK